MGVIAGGVEGECWVAAVIKDDRVGCHAAHHSGPPRDGLSFLFSPVPSPSSLLTPSIPVSPDSFPLFSVLTPVFNHISFTVQLTTYTHY